MFRNVILEQKMVNNLLSLESISIDAIIISVFTLHAYLGPDSRYTILNLGDGNFHSILCLFQIIKAKGSCKSICLANSGVVLL